MKETITYDDFIKVDIRAGTIISWESVPKSKKLLKFQVDFGQEIGIRTILSGIASSYGIDNDPTGLKVLAIINLTPRSMMGIESHGMLLAATGTDGKPYLATVSSVVRIMDDSVANGAEIE